MTVRLYACLFLLGSGAALAISAFQAAPGYMDADYYFATGRQLATGQGFWEPFLWNYLDNPAGLPHPAFTYWMPLAALIAAAGMKIAGVASFGAARAGFVLLAGAIPPLTAALAWRLEGRRQAAVLAGALAAIPGFYLPFLATTDTFGVSMLLGALFFLAAGDSPPGRALAFSPSSLRQAWRALSKPLALGALAGLLHLARADGVAWLAIGAAALWPDGRRGAASDGDRQRYGFWASLPGLLAGYLLVMAPWLGRNLAQFGSPFPPGASRALWITSYDQLYRYPASDLTPTSWWAAGAAELLRARLWALGQNLQTALAVQGEVFLAPLVILGGWRIRRERRVQLAALAWLLTFLGMTLAFPLQGGRGGFFHAGAALQPAAWALAAAGLGELIAWGERRRGWRPGRAWATLGGGAIGLAMLLTALTACPRFVGEGAPWGRGEAAYTLVEQALREAGAAPGQAVLVNNPPGYFAATGRPALAIPDGDESAARQVALRYGAAYLVLEGNHPRGLDSLYRRPEDRPGWRYLSSAAGAHLFAASRAGE